jgi:hypothetical protein
LSDDLTIPRRSLRRAAISLAVIALGWTVALLLGPPSDSSSTEEGRMAWLIPVGAAALSVLCFRQARTYGDHSPTDVRQETTHD